MTHHERLAALNAFMCDYDFTSVTIGDSPFTLERPRKAFDFAPPTEGNVYNFPVPDKQEGETMADKRIIEPYKGGRTHHAPRARLTEDEHARLKAILDIGESMADWIVRHIEIEESKKYVKYDPNA